MEQGGTGSVIGYRAPIQSVNASEHDLHRWNFALARMRARPLQFATLLP